VDSDFDGMISWPEMRRYLEGQLQQVRAAMDDLEGPMLYRAQGEAKRLVKCLNLPAAMTVTMKEEGTQ